jgi:hypothetical protein
MLRPVSDVESVLRDGGFWIAVVIAGVGAALVWLRLRHGGIEPGFAIAAIVAGVVGLRVDDLLPVPLVVGLAMLVGGERLARDGTPLALAVALLPGALVLGASLPDGWPFWMRVVAVATAAVGGVIAAGTQQQVPRSVPLLLGIGAVGVYLCVPDTEAATVLLGALVGVAALVLVPNLQPSLGLPAVVGLFAWVAAHGGLGRPGSVVGAVGCLGVVVLLPFARWRARRPHRIIDLAAVQILLVAWESRVAGFEQSAWAALGLTLAAFALSWIVLVVSARAGH